MKKQFNRMRQLANQTVGRAEKTEVLSEDLLQVEKRLELVKQVSHSTHKKLTACLQGQQGLDADKRSKKLPLTTLAQCLMEGSAVLGDDSLLGKMLRLCGEAEDKLAQELIHFELQVERDVIEPLFVLAEVEIPNIQKQRKHLAKLVLDMDSSRTRWQQSVKSSGLASNLQPSGAKADALREEMEEAANRVEICRDQLSADMYNFVAKEVDYANYFQTLIEVQAEYHRKSLALLQNFLPQIKAQQGECPQLCPTPTRALKSYLRELPEPLMTFELYEEWIQASNIPEQEKRLQALWNACEKLPKANYNNIRYVIKFLAKLTEYQDMNKMTPSNVAIVLGPNLLWPQAEGNMTEMMTTLSLQIVGIIEPLIQHADWFFPGDIEFNVTGNYGSPLHVNHNANYSSMPSPDMDHGERRQHDQARRPLSVATDNMMLEFYKKDGLGVRVMDTSWVARRGTSAGRKATSAPPAAQPPAPPAELPPHAPLAHSRAVAGDFSNARPRLPPASASPRQPSGQGAKKLAPIPPPGRRGRRAGGSRPPASLSPTPPSTPSPYGPLGAPPGAPPRSLPRGPGRPPPPPLLPPPPPPPPPPPGPGLAPKARGPRPALPPPPQPPPAAPPHPPQPPEPPRLDTAGPGDGALTGLLRFEVPSLHVSPEAALCRDPPEAAQRLSGPSLSPRQEEEEESESTAAYDSVPVPKLIRAAPRGPAPATGTEGQGQFWVAKRPVWGAATVL
ncbi:LOW QUALITY PROTEIN: rho GTPase-activating protein 44 [Cyanocitta cristata]